MALQYSVALRDNQLDQIEVTLGASALLLVFSGAPPGTCAAADTGTLLATVALPADWMQPASGGVKVKSGTWQDTSADGTGIAGHFRMKDAAGTTCHLQGTVGAIGSGAEMEVDNTSFNSGQMFTVNSFQVAAGNA
jgi:hypothetical protein